MDISEALQTSPLFNRRILIFGKTRQLRLPHEALIHFVKHLIKHGNASWIGKNENQRLKIIWRTYDQWAKIIQDYVHDKMLYNTVLSIYELREADNVINEEFYMLDYETFMNALKMLEKRNLAAVFQGSSDDSTSVKFFSP